jgi:hypothetical protein
MPSEENSIKPIKRYSPISSISKKLMKLKKPDCWQQPFLTEQEFRRTSYYAVYTEHLPPESFIPSLEDD